MTEVPAERTVTVAIGHGKKAAHSVHARLARNHDGNWAVGAAADHMAAELGPGSRYEIDLGYCKGCGICEAECPCGPIDMVPERI